MLVSSIIPENVQTLGVYAPSYSLMPTSSSFGDNRLDNICMITLLESRTQAAVVVSMEMGQEPVLAVWRRFICLPAKFIHHKPSAWHQLPVRQPKRPCPSWAVPCPVTPMTAPITNHVRMTDGIML